jgi:hypothetical protein
VLRPLSWKDEVSCTSLLAHAVLFRGLRERIPTTTGPTHSAENIQTRWLLFVVESSQLMHTMEKFSRGALTKTVMPDRSKIAVTSENEIKYWTKHFGVTREELERAVERVSNSAASVRKELRNLAPDPQ